MKHAWPALAKQLQGQRWTGHATAATSLTNGCGATPGLHRCGGTVRYCSTGAAVHTAAECRHLQSELRLAQPSLDLLHARQPGSSVHLHFRVYATWFTAMPQPLILRGRSEAPRLHHADGCVGPCVVRPTRNHTCTRWAGGGAGEGGRGSKERKCRTQCLLRCLPHFPACPHHRPRTRCGQGAHSRSTRWRRTYPGAA